MHENFCSFQQLPFSKLFNTYISDFSKMSDFFVTNPFSEEDLGKVRVSEQSKELRGEFAQTLKKYHEKLGIADTQSSQLEKFSNPDCLAVVTGQQLGVYGGPLFTIYKTITTILLARKLEKKLNKPIVPVFWLADEDHDFEEIASIGIPAQDSLHKISLQQEGNGHPVSDQFVMGSIRDFAQEVKNELFDTDFSEDLWSILNQCYQEGFSHVEAFAKLMNSIFSEEGLLIVGSNFDGIKELVKDVFIKSITDADSIQNALESQSIKLEEEFHRQVIVGESNLFLIDEEKGRVKLDRNGKVWNAGDLTFDEEKLISMIDSNPSKFSPNVFLRPVVQDVLIPNLGYVAGPGELAYYAQMKELYPVFELEMPTIFPRLSATLIENGIERIMTKLPFEMCSYNQRIEDLEATYVAHSNSNDLDGLFREWKEKLEETVDGPLSQIKTIDPTLEGMVGKVAASFSNELDKLKGRVFRSIKQQEQTQLNRIARIKSQLFPDGLQERSVSPVYFMNKYGTDIWIKLLKDFEDDEIDLSTHHIIKL